MSRFAIRNGDDYWIQSDTTTYDYGDYRVQVGPIGEVFIDLGRYAVYTAVQPDSEITVQDTELDETSDLAYRTFTTADVPHLLHVRDHMQELDHAGMIDPAEVAALVGLGACAFVRSQQQVQRS